MNIAGVEVPKVSIALCTFNAEKYLREQLDSIVNQTYSYIEVVVCDDCSADSTIRILRDYAKTSGKSFKIYRNKKNLGFIKNFEKAISLCDGEYIALSDHDDIWDKDKISVLIENIKDNILIYSDSEIIDEKGNRKNKKLSEVFRYVTGSNFRRLIFHNCISGHQVLFKKEIKRYALPFPDVLYHDWWIAYVALSVGKVGYVDRILVKYRMHGKNLSDTTLHAFNMVNHKENEEPGSKKWGAFKNNRAEIKKLTIYRNFNFYNDRYKNFFDTFVKLMIRRENQILSIRYLIFWLRYGRDFLYASRSSDFKKFRFIIRKVVGMGPKKLYYKLRGKYTVS